MLIQVYKTQISFLNVDMDRNKQLGSTVVMFLLHVPRIVGSIQGKIRYILSGQKHIRLRHHWSLGL